MAVELEGSVRTKDRGEDRLDKRMGIARGRVESQYIFLVDMAHDHEQEFKGQGEKGSHVGSLRGDRMAGDRMEMLWDGVQGLTAGDERSYTETTWSEFRFYGQQDFHDRTK